MATMNTQPLPANRRADAMPPAATSAARVPDRPVRDTTAADAALADLFPALRLRNAATAPRDPGGR